MKAFFPVNAGAKREAAVDRASANGADKVPIGACVAKDTIISLCFAPATMLLNSKLQLNTLWQMARHEGPIGACVAKDIEFAFGSSP